MKEKWQKKQKIQKNKIISHYGIFSPLFKWEVKKKNEIPDRLLIHANFKIRMQLLQNPITAVTITITIILFIITCTVYDSANGARLINLCNITADRMAFASEVKHFFLNVHDICRANLLAHVTWNAMATSCVTYWWFICHILVLYFFMLILLQTFLCLCSLSGSS